jgi:methylated-DNA-[protein]-cysteine S-methyltransferase
MSTSHLRLIDQIPYGEVRTYRQLAESWGNSKASRATGQACKRNPIPLIIPCHRVIQSAGGKIYYSDGNHTHARDQANLNRKQRLLDLEQGRDWIF